MAIFHFSAKIVSRANGSSAVAAAAYRSASRLNDERLGRAHDFTNKAGVIHSEILAPTGTPSRWQDREALWNEVEAAEARKDAQLAREVEFALPRELNAEEGVELAREFVLREFVDRGMVADLNVHWDVGDDGLPKPHAHVMLTLRAADPENFGQKTRDWNRRDLLEQWRANWSDHVNQRLAALGVDARIDHRTLKDQGLDLEPQHKIGAAAARREWHGELAERVDEHREIAWRNGQRIISDPDLALNGITHQQSTFTQQDLARFLHRHTDGKDQFDWAMAAVSCAPGLVSLGPDGEGAARFTSRSMLAVEQSLSGSAERIADRRHHLVPYRALDLAEKESAGRRVELSADQARAVRHVLHSGDLAVVIGYAGSGKSAMLGTAREAWEASGYRVRGAALSGIAAENLASESGIQSSTLASLERAWDRGRGQFGQGDVLVVDEAGLVGSRQMQRILANAEDAGAKVVLLGDPEQLQAIEAGAAFRALSERHGATEMTDIRRQTESWQKLATRHLATGRTYDALQAYDERGHIHQHGTGGEAVQATVAAWMFVRAQEPNASQLMLSYTRRQATELNEVARDGLATAGELNGGRIFETERGPREFAPGDRVAFLRNDRALGVRNGSLGSVESLSPDGLSVRLDDGRTTSFNLREYGAIDHGYAMTIHKAQGSTVDHAHVLASRFMDRHATYVALSRHRLGASLHYDSGEFTSSKELANRLGRERSKDTTLDYTSAAAAGQRGAIAPPQWCLEPLERRESGHHNIDGPERERSR